MNCSTCIHYDANGFVRGYGICRRFPPTPYVGKEETEKVWPPVSDDDRCGEHCAVTALDRKPKSGIQVMAQMSEADRIRVETARRTWIEAELRASKLFREFVALNPHLSKEQLALIEALRDEFRKTFQR